MSLFDAADIAGAVDDLGSDATLDSGVAFRGVFRSDFNDDNLTDVRVDGTKSALIIPASVLDLLSIKKTTGVTVEGRAFIVRQIQPATSGFVRLVLAAK